MPKECDWRSDVDVSLAEFEGGEKLGICGLGAELHFEMEASVNIPSTAYQAIAIPKSEDDSVQQSLARQLILRPPTQTACRPNASTNTINSPRSLSPTPLLPSILTTALHDNHLLRLTLRNLTLPNPSVIVVGSPWTIKTPPPNESTPPFIHKILSQFNITLPLVSKT